MGTHVSRVQPRDHDLYATRLPQPFIKKLPTNCKSLFTFYFQTGRASTSFAEIFLLFHNPNKNAHVGKYETHFMIIYPRFFYS